MDAPGGTAGPPAERRASVEAALVRAARELLEEGYAFQGLSVEMITRRAGIGRTAFYFYFRDKRELLMKLARDTAQELYERADRWWHAPGDAMADVGPSLAAIGGVYLEQAATMRAIVEAASYDEEVQAFWQGLVQRFIDATRERIERDQAAGVAAPVPAAEVACALVWMCERSLYQFASARPGEDPAVLVEALTQIFLRAVYGRLPE